MENIKLLHTDCMEYMASLPDNAFNLAIVDPPYGIGFDGNTTVKGKSGKAKTFSSKQHHIKKQWDFERPSGKYFKELQRISKNQIIWGGNYFADLLSPQRGWIFWDKKITNSNNKNFSDGELAWTSFNCILRRFSYDWIGFGYLNNPQEEKKIHPTQKPVQLYKWLLMNYAKEGDTIFDSHGGSMSLAIAAYDLGFDCTICEIDRDYYDAAVKRFNQHKAQLVLF